VYVLCSDGIRVFLSFAHGHVPVLFEVNFVSWKAASTDVKRICHRASSMCLWYHAWNSDLDANLTKFWCAQFWNVISSSWHFTTKPVSFCACYFSVHNMLNENAAVVYCKLIVAKHKIIGWRTSAYRCHGLVLLSYSKISRDSTSLITDVSSLHVCSSRRYQIDC